MAPAASAAPGLQPFFSYSAVFTGSGTFTIASSQADGSGSSTTRASFKWSTAYKNIFIPQVKNTQLIGYPAVGAKSTASGQWSINVTNSDPGGNCTGNGDLGRPAGGFGNGGIKLQRTGKKNIAFQANALSGYTSLSGTGDGSVACQPKDFWHDDVLTAGVGQNENDGLEPLTGLASITPKDLKGASFTKQVVLPDGEAPPGDCGTTPGIVTCTQSYSWTGSVKFTKKKLH